MRSPPCVQYTLRKANMPAEFRQVAELIYTINSKAIGLQRRGRINPRSQA
jgi:hypothetical protein